MRLTCALLLAAAAAGAVAAPAAADAPWSAPAAVPGAAGSSAPVVVTPAGHGAVATGVAGASDTLLTPVGADGRLGAGRRVALSSARLVTYGSDRIALAGATPGLRFRVALAIGTPAGGVGSPRALPGTAGQTLFALAGSPSGTLALVTGTSNGRRERVVWVRRDGKLRRVLTIRVGSRARGAAVALGPHGDVLVAWEDDHEIRSRHLGPTGRAGAVHRLGAGVQSQIEVRFDDSGRQEVAWETQRVAEGDALTPATVSYASAAKGRGFTKAVVVGRSDLLGTGHYVAAPGVRLVGSGSDSSVLALTTYDGANFRVQSANAVAGRVQALQTLSPAGQDAVLGDLAYARAGGTLVLWRTGTRGNDPSGPQRVFASTRPSGFPDFGAPEAISDPADTLIGSSPFGAVDPQTGAALAAFGRGAAGIAVSARAPLSGSGTPAAAARRAWAPRAARR